MKLHRVPTHPSPRLILGIKIRGPEIHPFKLSIATISNCSATFLIPPVDVIAKMLYELIAIVRPGNLGEVKEIAQTVGSLVLKNGGVVRGLANWGVFSLPKPISVHQMKHTHGHYFVMRYDAASKVHQDVRNTLRLEPRMIRAAHVKLGDGKLETLARFGPPKWKTTGSEA